MDAAARRSASKEEAGIARFVLPQPYLLFLGDVVDAGRRGGYAPPAMKTNAFALTGAFAAFAAFGIAASPAFGQDAAVPDHTLSEFRLGEHFSGDDVSLDDLSGKVVVIEKWGVF
jgi:hypothetical protein